MEKNLFIKKATAFLIIILFIVASFIPSISGNTTELDKKQSIKLQKQVNDQEEVLVTCYNFGMPGEPSKEIEIPQHEAEYLYEKIKELNFAVASDTLSEITQQLQIEIIDLADEYDLLPIGLSKNQVKEQYIHAYKSRTNRVGFMPQTQSKASEFLCTFVSSGSGGVLPIIALPRLIPILMIPIPRLFMIWRAQEAVTSCGGLRSGTGFIAYGQQNGIALGFWGLGFTFSLPPIMGVYGLAGYSLYASVDAEYIEFYPPNSPPVISQIDPGDGEINVPLSLSELRFQISDLNGELMSYTVTTSPDIGSGSGNLKPDGVYSVPISGLEDLTEYSWHIEVTDGMDTTVKDSHFTTEANAPIVSNPDPYNDERFVSVGLSELSFHLKDYQDDPIDYTVETSPNIGSGSGSGVDEGTYTIPVSGLDYSMECIWYVNATDGEHETRKIFNFQIEHEMIFDPFDKGWQYRKEIIIDHTKVDGDLVNFPILTSTTDEDLRDKTQDDGDDILFMDGAGIANRMYHEIELFDGESGELVAWVNVANLDADQDTILYIYYGNSGSSCQQASELVWDMNYEAVWHMDDHTQSTIDDSTSNYNTGVKENDPSEINAKIGKAQDFEESDKEEIIVYDGVYECDSDEDITMEYWIKIETFQGFAMNCDNDDYGYYSMNNKDAGYFSSYFFSRHPYTIVHPMGTTFCQPDIWYYVAGKLDRNAGYGYIYVDGLEEARVGIDELGGLEGLHHFRIGGSYSSAPSTYTDGIIDEVRISNIAREPTWILTTFQNQNDPSNFMSIGPEEPAP